MAHNEVYLIEINPALRIRLENRKYYWQNNVMAVKNRWHRITKDYHHFTLMCYVNNSGRGSPYLKAEYREYGRGPHSLSV